ncbi:hypothetical protein, variant 1 [Fonticula alba]|uniref:Uncharacterized protein n=1 Tax=Fonticula alba TaxID=691883 RepID=A0A058Z8G3_FONAL|nr:hypothetical protein, variant 1 [Fonticula alba]KCV70213.1 hypothetical protein, variant 1 [Fonticula alba]|eukprot:XP_009494730.1 hypothetical protein, variant 1 [Fonticula alba]
MTTDENKARYFYVKNNSNKKKPSSKKTENNVDPAKKKAASKRDGKSDTSQDLNAYSHFSPLFGESHNDASVEYPCKTIEEAILAKPGLTPVEWCWKLVVAEDEKFEKNNPGLLRNRVFSKTQCVNPGAEHVKFYNSKIVQLSDVLEHKCDSLCYSKQRHHLIFHYSHHRGSDGNPGTSTHPAAGPRDQSLEQSDGYTHFLLDVEEAMDVLFVLVSPTHGNDDIALACAYSEPKEYSCFRTIACAKAAWPDHTVLLLVPRASTQKEIRAAKTNVADTKPHDVRHLLAVCSRVFIFHN